MMKIFVLFYITITIFGCSSNEDGGSNLVVDKLKDLIDGNQSDNNQGEQTSNDENNNSTPSNSTWQIQFGSLTQKSFAEADHSQEDYCYSVVSDSEGNVYCSGYTYGSLGEANGGSGKSDAVIIKLNKAGEIVWITQLSSVTKAEGGDNSKEDWCNRIHVDSDQNVYCAGGTEGNMKEPNGNGGSNDSRDVILLKLNANGSLAWLTHIGTTTAGSHGLDVSGSEHCEGIDIDSSGNVYCAGHTTGSLAEANGDDTWGTEDIIFVKLNSSGELQWVKQLGASTVSETSYCAYTGGNVKRSQTYDYCYDVRVDNNDNVYCAGETLGNLGESNDNCWTKYDAVIVKMNSAGSLQWIKQFGKESINDSASFGNSDEDDFCSGLEIDSSGNIYCAGATKSSMGETNGGSFDLFTAKLDTNGNISWLTQLGNDTKAPGGDNSNWEKAFTLTIDNSGNVYSAGQTWGSMGETNASDGNTSDLVYYKLNSSGELQWLKQIGQASIFPGGNVLDNEYINGIFYDTNLDAIYITGSSQGSLVEANAGSDDIIILKFNQDGDYD